MNPIFQNRPQVQPQINLKSDPRQQVLGMISQMNPAQRQKLKALLPKAQGLANKFGINFDSVATEINNL